MYPRPRFTLVQLQYFVEAADSGNISVAASKVYASQSTLSSAIRHLEHELGCSLLIRHQARGVSLTPNGYELYARARALLRQASEFEETGRALQEELSGSLFAGFFVTLAPFYVPEVMPQLQQRYPSLEMQVLEADGAGLHAAIREGRCEIALTYDLEIGEDMTFEPVVEVKPYAMVSARHPVAGREVASLRELARRPMVMLDLPEPSRFMLDLLERAGANPSEIVRTTSFETMRGLVATGDCFAIVNQRPDVLSPRAGSVCAVEISEAESLTIGALHVGGVRPHRRMTAFVAECRDAVARLAHPG